MRPVFDGIAWYCMALDGAGWYWMVLDGSRSWKSKLWVEHFTKPENNDHLMFSMFVKSAF